MNKQPQTSRRKRGFTMIELMCAVSVAGILSSVAYPTFTSVIHKARRSDALVAMMQVQMAQERHRANHAAYGSLDEIGVAAQSSSRHYTLVVSASSESGYEAQATAVGSQAADSNCRVLKLKLDGFNLTESSGPSASVDNPTEVNRKCWSL
jgi:type IV pilus assembly protein PilE